jgi:ABC-type antimicrobial peptide transport system permease subunit
MNTLKTTLRSLRRNGVYSAVNIVGLAVSLTAAIFILLWVQDELNRNKCFKNAEQIYQYGACSFENEATFITDRFPEVLQACKTTNTEVNLGVLSLNHSEKFTLSNIYLVDSNFFSFFNINLLLGNPKQPFEEKRSIMLTETYAKRLFKEENPIGKVIQSEYYGNFYVTAVLADFPKNSSLQFNALVHTSFFSDWLDWMEINRPQDYSWRCRFTTYLMLSKNTDYKVLAIKIAEEQHKDRNREGEFNPETDWYSKLIPVTKMHLYDYWEEKESEIKKVRLFSSIIFVLILIAVINYVNLVTARLIDRAKEVEIRKILGESKFGLFMQMMRETMVMVFIALILATLLIELLLPYYNILIDKQLDFSFANLEIWAIYIGMFVVVSFSAGIYPAMRLISFKPTGLSSFHQTVRKKFILRKILITVQFTFTLIFITVAIVMNLQMRFMKERDPGFLKENIFMLPLHNIAGHYEAVKQDLLHENDIADITATLMPINGIGWCMGTGFTDENGEEKEFFTMFIWGDYNMLDFFNIPILDGTGFNQHDNQGSGLIMNDEALKKLGFKNPIGMPFNFSSEQTNTIIGHIKDFNFSSLHEEIEALTVLYNLENINYLYIKAFPGKQQEAIETVEKVWKHYNDGYPFNYRFIDDDFDVKYKADIQKERLFNIFAFIAIFVSCLGLFGLITYTTETKTKEIGLRKVHGAGIKDITTMLTKEFLILVCISMFVAFPLAYFWLTKMLQDYAYRISLSWWMFALAAIVTIVLTVFTVGFTALRAATANPVKAIAK